MTLFVHLLRRKPFCLTIQKHLGILLESFQNYQVSYSSKSSIVVSTLSQVHRSSEIPLLVSYHHHLQLWRGSWVSFWNYFFRFDMFAAKGYSKYWRDFVLLAERQVRFCIFIERVKFVNIISGGRLPRYTEIYTRYVWNCRAYNNRPLSSILYCGINADRVWSACAMPFFLWLGHSRGCCHYRFFILAHFAKRQTPFYTHRTFVGVVLRPDLTPGIKSFCRVIFRFHHLCYISKITIYVVRSALFYFLHSVEFHLSR